MSPIRREVMIVWCRSPRSVLRTSYMHRASDPALIAKYSKIALDFRLNARRFFRIVREFYRWSSIDRGHLANDRDGIQIDRAIRRTSHEIIGQIGAPAKTQPDPAGKMTVSLFDRVRHPWRPKTPAASSLGHGPFCFHHLMISSPAAIGGALSGRKPVQSATHSGASRRNALVPKASGRAIRRLPP